MLIILRSNLVVTKFMVFLYLFSVFVCFFSWILWLGIIYLFIFI